MPGSDVTRDEYFRLARSLGREAGVLDGVHAYFEKHRDRLWTTIDAFDLLGQRRAHVLCIGPFLDYTPFLFKAHVADAVTVLEADSFAAALDPLYRAHAIEVVRDNVTDLLSTGSGRLPWADDTFDVVCCWETMEHFNFNPVPFVRELRRIVRPGGIVCITVPNSAKLDARLNALVGRSNATPIADYERHAGKTHFGFHWREYTLGELRALFTDQGFEIDRAQHLATFQNRPLSAVGKLRRLGARIAAQAVPAFGALCTVQARKT